VLNTIEFVSYVRSLDVRLSVDAEGRLSCTAPKGVITPELKEELKARKPALLEFLTAATEVPGAPPPLVKADRTGPLRPSSGQERMWFVQQMDPESTAYNLAGGARLVGKLDRESLERSLREIIRRHEALRTTMVEVDGAPQAIIRDAADWTMDFRSLLHLPPSERERELLGMGQAMARQPFYLASGPLLRACLVEMAANEHVLLLSMHHIAGDGWSWGVLQKELAALYGAFSKGQPSPLPELTLIYGLCGMVAPD